MATTHSKRSAFENRKKRTVMQVLERIAALLSVPAMQKNL